jgi:outer membrane biosynthesis protein TonB
MVRGIRRNRIIAGGYADKGSGGICPMLAAHRNGGRTDFGTFAQAWDEFTGEAGAGRPRRATKREVGTLLSYLELSLIQPDTGRFSLKEAVARIRSERRASAARAARDTDQAEIESLLEAPDIQRPHPEPEPYPEPVPEPSPQPGPEPVPDPVPEPYPPPEVTPGPARPDEPEPVGIDRDGDPLVERIVDEVLLRQP